MPAITPADLLARELRRDPGRPFLTWYDDATGDRVELSVATASNWAAKVAGHLVDEHDAEPGTVVGVRLPAHWQTAVLLLGIWSTGAAVGLQTEGDVTVGTDPGADIALALDPMGASLSRLVAVQPDVFVPVTPVDPTALALRVDGRSWTHSELVAAAVTAARAHGVDENSRVLSTLGYDTVDGLDAGLLVPLAGGASVVLVADADPTKLGDRQRAERVTLTIT